MQNGKHVTIPLVANFKLSSAQCPQSGEEVDYMSRVPYSSVVGSLMYTMVCSRPYLTYAVSMYMEKHVKEHKAVQWIMLYLLGYSSVFLQFGRIRDGLIGYVDSNYVGYLDKRRSLIGYVFTIRGCSINWKATL